MPTEAAARARLLVQEIVHPDEMNRFAAACEPTEPGELAGLRLRTQAYLAWVRDEAGRRSSLDLDTAEAIGRTLTMLLDEPDLYDAEQRALLRGAVGYFVDAEDSANDVTDAIGFDDDVRVVNAVLDALGRRDLHIALG
jgi:hypothetical protein